MLVFSVLAIERSTTKNETDEHNLHQKNMFNLFSKNPIKALEKEHQRLLVQARDLQRAGDIQAFAAKTAEAETLYEEIQQKKAKSRVNENGCVCSTSDQRREVLSERSQSFGKRS